MWGIRTTTDDVRSLEQEFLAHKKVVDEYMENCTKQHSEHVQHRRRLEDKLDDVLKYLKEISETLKENKPIIERAHNNFITVDTIKTWALWIGAIGAAAASVAAMFKFYG